MSPQLQSYADAYRTSQDVLHTLADPLTDEQFNWKPDAKSWSVAECIVHLNTIAKGYSPALAASLEGNPPKGSGPFRYGMISRLFIRSVRPEGPSMPTGGPMNPSKGGVASDIEKERALASFDAYTDRMVEICGSADGADYSRIKVRSPFLSFMRLPLGAFLDALGQHAIRHARQAERVTQRPDFPV